MPVIIGTNKIKSVLDIDSVGIQVTSGQKVILSDEKFLDHNVQVAIHMGWLESEEKPSSEVSGNKLRIRNVLDRPISIPGLIRELKANQPAIIDEAQARSSAIQAAIAKGILRIEGPIEEADASEGSVKIGDIFDTAEADEFFTGEDATILTSDSVKKEEEKELETNDELLGTVKVIDSPNPDPVKVNKDPHKQATIWNPSGNTVMNPMSNAIIAKGKEIKQIIVEHKEKLDFTAMQKVADGDVKDDTPTDDDKLGFVDKELEQERINAHPKLKNKEKAGQTEEMDFVG